VKDLGLKNKIIKMRSEVNMTNKKENAPTASRVLYATAGSAYGFGWDQMKKFFLDLFLITVILGVVYIPLAMINSLDGRGTGSAFVFLKAVRGDKFEVKDIFSPFENIERYLNVILAEILKSAIIVIGLFFLFVPGIIFACKLVFVKYLILDRNMGAVEAVKESWNMTKGYAVDIFLIGLIAVPLAIAGLICFLVGIIPVIMWVRCAFATMYYAVSKVAEEKAG
jgi:uncharacterized membrane protein